MTRMNDWRRDIYEGLRVENWSLSGPNRIVKVVPRGAETLTALGGYIATGIALAGKTPLDIEKILGLRVGFLKQGVRIYRFARLPMTHEYEYELTAAYPDGLAFDPAHSCPDYPPGSAKVHQWRIKDGFHVPADPNFLDVMPGQRFPYDWLQSH